MFERRPLLLLLLLLLVMVVMVSSLSDARQLSDVRLMEVIDNDARLVVQLATFQLEASTQRQPSPTPSNKRSLQLSPTISIAMQLSRMPLCAPLQRQYQHALSSRLKLF